VPEDTPTPEPTPTATLSPTPAGPFAAISGPSTAEVNDTVVFTNASAPGNIGVDWSGCSQTLNANACSLTIVSTGCHSVTLVAYYPQPDGAKSTVHYVAVGENVTCP
jgi:hypothetical protein